MIKRNIPNAITCLNVLSGCVAIIFSFSAFEPFGTLMGWQCAMIAIGAAAIADFFDGFSARLLHAYSEMGKELDSLCDLVSFGVAPAMLLLNVLRGASFHPGWMLWAILLIPICGALRLAKFNIDTRQTTSFLGLPIPANAIFWIGICSAIASGIKSDSLSFIFLTNPWVMLPLIAGVSLAMVSRFPLISLKFKNYSLKGNIRKWLLIAGTILLVAIFGLSGFALTIILYLLLSIGSGNK